MQYSLQILFVVLVIPENDESLARAFIYFISEFIYEQAIAPSFPSITFLICFNKGLKVS
jgi:hypothetical protein